MADRLLKPGEALERTQKERLGMLIRPCDERTQARFRQQSNGRARFTQAEYLSALMDVAEEMRAIADGRVKADGMDRAVITELLRKHGLESVTF
jgi:hypothetical protein